MALTTKLMDEVPWKVRDQGQADFWARAVTIREGGDWWVEATVKGDRKHEVSLDREGRDVIALCNCRDCLKGYDVCRHIWATLLAAESKGYLGGDSRKAPEHLFVEDDKDEGWDPDYDGFDGAIAREAAPASARAPSRPKLAPRKAKPRPADWKHTLSSLRSTMEQQAKSSHAPLSAGQEIVYIVDVEATMAGNGLALDVATRSRKKDGEWSKPRGQRFQRAEIDALPDPADRHALHVLAGARIQDTGPYGYSSYYNSYTSYQSVPTRCYLSEGLYEALLPTLCATGRCLLRLGKEDEDPRTLRWDGDAPWEFYLKVMPDPAGRKRYLISGELRRGEERLPLSAPHLLVAGGLVFWEDRVARLRDFDAFHWIALLRKQGEVFVPARQKDDLLAELLRLPSLPRLDLPEELQFEEVRVVPRPLLKIKPPDGSVVYGRGATWLVGALSFDYDGQVVPAKQPGRSLYEPSRRRLLLRDRDAEREAEARLERAGFRRQTYYGRGEVLELAPRHLPNVVRTLLQEGWRVEAEGKLYRTPGEFRIEVTSGIDWFEVHGGAKFGDQEVPLPTLLAALRRGDNMVPLGDGTVGMLPEEWLKKYGLLGEIGKAEGDHLRFGRTQVGLLDSLLAEQPEARVDEQFERARDQLRRFQGIAPADPPPGFAGELRGYQRDGLGWLHFLREFGFGGCLADDMGLGKTVQVLALLEARRELRASMNGKANGRAKAKRNDGRPGPSLVVVPRSVVYNWKQEAARFAPGLRVLDHSTVDRAAPGAHFDDYDLVLTTYGTLRRDIVDLKDYRFDYAILDEAQAIKNAKSQSAKAARLLSADHRLALSGTPVENHLGELWSLFEYLNPGMLGAASALRLADGGLRNPDEAGRSMLARALRPFLLRRTKQQVAKDLPEKNEQTLYCDMEPAQHKLYDELREHYRRSLLPRVERDGLNRSKIQILEALLRLRQAACHPALIDKASKAPSAKLDLLLPQLQDVFEEGHKTLVFSQFTSLLAIVKQRLDAEGIPYEYLDGRTRDRAARVERFQGDPDCKLFLISLKAGGLGLNLTAADYVFLLDPWWNPAVESQAIDRAHRIGQTRPVFAYRIIARDTVEEKVLQLQSQKRALADAIITADNSVIRDLGREDLELLLS